MQYWLLSTTTVSIQLSARSRAHTPLCDNTVGVALWLVMVCFDFFQLTLSSIVWTTCDENYRMNEMCVRMK